MPLLTLPPGCPKARKRRKPSFSRTKDWPQGWGQFPNGPGRKDWAAERDPFVFPPDFHKMQILNKLFIVLGGARGQGERRGAELGKATSPLSLTWVLSSPF